jgi:hypothetical protein
MLCERIDDADAAVQGLTRGVYLLCSNLYVFIIIGLTQLADGAFGRAALYFSIVCGFSALRAENRTLKIGKYHAAAGEKCDLVTRNNATV